MDQLHKQAGRWGGSSTALEAGYPNPALPPAYMHCDLKFIFPVHKLFIIIKELQCYPPQTVQGKARNNVNKAAVPIWDHDGILDQRKDICGTLVKIL